MNDAARESPEMNGEEKNRGAETPEEKKQRVLAELEAKQAAIAERRRAVQERRRIGRIVGIVVAVVLALAISIYGVRSLNRHHAGSTATPARARVSWGVPVNGLQAGLLLKSVHSEPEPLADLVVHVRNVGASPARLLRLSTARAYWGGSYPFEIRSAGQRLRYVGVQAAPPPPPPVTEFRDLGPGASDRTDVTLRMADWSLLPPFEASLTFTLAWNASETIASPYDRERDRWTDVTGLWTGEARSGSVTVKIE